MTQDALLAYAHFVLIFCTVSLLAVELAVCTRDATPARLHRLRIIDGLYGMSAMLTLASGAARVWLGAKGSAFYLGNPVFYAKVGLFLAVGLLSIYPTIQYLRWAAAIDRQPGFLPQEAALAKVRSLLKVQMVLLAAIPLLATLMARGIGH